MKNYWKVLIQFFPYADLIKWSVFQNDWFIKYNHNQETGKVGEGKHQQKGT